MTTQPILIFSEGISMGHVVRPLLIARWLRELELPIIIACPESRRSFFTAEGFVTTAITIPDSHTVYTRLQQPNQPMYSVAELHAEAQQDEALLDELDPCLVLADFRFMALLAAHARGIPTVNITSASCHPAFDTIRTGWPEPYLPPRLPESIGDPVYRAGLGQALAKIILPHLATSLRAVAQHQGYAVLPTFFDYASFGDLCLLCDHPAVMPLPQLRPQDIYTGALIWDRPAPLPAAITRLSPHIPTIYLAPGTQESLPMALLLPYIEQLLHNGFQIILSKGHRAGEIALTHPRLVVEAFINDSRLLDRVALFVHHGGQMSTYQGMAHAVPMLALPPIADSYFHAKAIEQQGIGRMLRPSRLTQKALMATTLDLLTTPDYRSTAIELQARIRSFAAKTQLLERITQLVAQHAPLQARAFA